MIDLEINSDHRELKEQNKFIRSILNNFPTGVGIIYDNNSFTYMNEEFERVCGNFELSNINDFISIIRDDFRDTIFRALTNDYLDFIENIPIVKNAGGIGFICIKTIPIGNNNVIIAAWDSTDRVKASESIKRKRELITAILDHIPDSIILINKDKEIIWSNNSEFRSGEIICVDFHERIEYVFESEQMKEFETYENEIYYYYVIAPCHRNRDLNSVLLIRRDVTERKKAADRADFEELQQIVIDVTTTQRELKETVFKLYNNRKDNGNVS